MNARTFLMGIDNGGTVTKAALYDPSGREVAVSSVKTEMLFPHPGHTEKNVDDLWAANVRVIGEVMKKARVRPAEIAACAVTGHGNGMYLVDAAGKPAHDGINSADSRAADYVARWYQDGTFEKVLPRTCQAIWAAQPAALLAWFRDHDPAVLERTRWIFMCKDYIRYRLTGEACAEVTDYSGLNLMNVRTLRYDTDVLNAFGIAGMADKLPPLRGSGEICGTVSAAAAAETGLKAGTPVAGGLFDISACAIGTGITRPDRLCLIAGSWSINEFINPAPVQDRDLFMTSAYCIPGFWLITEASATSASNLEWVVSELMAGERAEAQARGGSVFDTVNRMVGKPGPAGFRRPVPPVPVRQQRGTPRLGGIPRAARVAREGAHAARRVRGGRVLPQDARRPAPCPPGRRGGGAGSAGGGEDCRWCGEVGSLGADVRRHPAASHRAHRLRGAGSHGRRDLRRGWRGPLRLVRPGGAGHGACVAARWNRGRKHRDIYGAKYARYRQCIEALRAAWNPASPSPGTSAG